MAAPQFYARDLWAVVTYTDPTPEFQARDLWAVVTYSGLVGTMDYVAGIVAGQVGHSRVYNRHRHTRNRAEFESLFVDGSGLEFWTVQRTRTKTERAGTQDAAEHVHTIQIEGIVRHKDDAVDANATEYQLQVNAELIADALRSDTTLGGNVELAWLGLTVIEDVEFAGIACHRARIDLQAQEYTTG